jgi:1,2-diacylglycerol 3-alpha-glucosyltransferase
MQKIKIFFICSGLGVINRGYESFTRECFDALKTDGRLEAYLYKGGGVSINKEKALFNLPRFKALAIFFGKILKTEGYTVEQFTFCISLIPYLLSKKPDVILVSDFILSTYLFHARRFFNLKYKIIFCNGAPNGPPFNRCDHVQQLLPKYYQLAIDGGTSPDMMSILPLGIKTHNAKLPSELEKHKIRQELGIPIHAFVFLSVGAINDHHKRMSYLLKEFANINISNAYFVILGQVERESPNIISLAKEKLPSNKYSIKSVPYEVIGDYYRCADAFVLSSLYEGFGLVYLEALSYGLPVIAHDTATFHQVLGEKGIFLDLKQEGSLSNFVNQDGLANTRSDSAKTSRIEYTEQRYGWQSLKEHYIQMIEKTVLG